MSLEHSFGIMHSNRWVGGLVLLYGLCSASQSCAQTSTTSPHFSAAAERAEREGNKVFTWILHNGANQKPAEDATPKAPAKPPTRVAKPVTRRKDVATAERTKDEDGSPVDAGSSAEPAKAVAAPLARPPTTASVPAPVASSIVTATEPPASAPEQPRQLASEPVEPAESVEPEEDQPLVLVHQVEPEYPLVVIRRMKKGSVQLRFEVQTDGSVKGVEVIETSNPRLNQPVIDAVAQWKFEPLRRIQVGEVEMGFDFR